MQMFIQGKQNPLENRVYIISAPFGEMRVQVIPAQIIAEKILEGVHRFYQQNRGQFNALEKMIFDSGRDANKEDNMFEGDTVDEKGKEELVYEEL